MIRGKVAGFAAFAMALAASTPAWASVTNFGSLGNFDAINDTGQECHGFEIELEGLKSIDVAFTFGAPYIRYGDPTVTDTAAGCLIRYASAWNAAASTWAVGTPTQGVGVPLVTGGHSLFDPTYGGDPGYPNTPGDHFGVALNGNPTKTTYRWLWGDNAGNLMPSGTLVKTPAPLMAVTPPTSGAAPAAVNAVVPALVNNTGKEFGDAMWVKVFVTESSNEVELEHLVAGDPAVPGRDADGEIVESETEVEWQLLQAGGLENELESGELDMGADSKSITRRYEFYMYIGGYDPETNEALVDNAVKHPEAVGQFLGSQNVAINLVPFEVPEPGSLLILAFGGIMALRRRQ